MLFVVENIRMEFLNQIDAIRKSSRISKNLFPKVLKKKLCRICLRDKNLLGIDVIMGRRDMLNSIKCPTRNEYPNYICQQCLSELKKTACFLRLLSDSTRYLNKYYGIKNYGRKMQSTKFLENNQKRDIKLSLTQYATIDLSKSRIKNNNMFMAKKQTDLNTKEPEDFKFIFERFIMKANPFLKGVEIIEKLRVESVSHRKFYNCPKLSTCNQILALTYSDYLQLFDNIVSNNKTNFYNSRKKIFNSRAYLCANCKKLYLTLDTLEKHICVGEQEKRLFFKDKIFPCSTCKISFESFSALAEHICYKYECQKCTVEFETFQDLNDHNDICHALLNIKATYECTLCDKHYKCNKSLVRHVYKKHPKKRNIKNEL